MWRWVLKPTHRLPCILLRSSLHSWEHWGIGKPDDWLQLASDGAGNKGQAEQLIILNPPFTLSSFVGTISILTHCHNTEVRNSSHGEVVSQKGQGCDVSSPGSHLWAELPVLSEKETARDRQRKHLSRQQSGHRQEGMSNGDIRERFCCCHSVLI